MKSSRQVAAKPGHQRISAAGSPIQPSTQAVKTLSQVWYSMGLSGLWATCRA